VGMMDELMGEVNTPRRNKWSEIQEKLDKKDFDEFCEALQEPKISQASLRRALAKRGVHIGTGTISELRRDYLRQLATR
jgi:ribosomal protein L29